MNYPNVLNAVTATKTSNAQSINNQSEVTIVFVASGIVAGNGVFQVDALIGGVWVTQVPLIDMNVANTNTQTPTRVLTVTLSSNTQKMYVLDSQISAEAIRIVVTVTTDGSYSAHVHTNLRR